MPTEQKIREFIKKLTLFNDILFRKAAENKEFCEEILQSFLADPTLSVIRHYPQKSLTNLQGRSIIVDLLCSIKGRVVNVEIQQANTLDHFRRVRYHGAVITANVTDPGTDFKDVPDLVIVYVTPFDILKRGRTKYVVKKTALDIGDVIEDGETDVYINAAVDDQSQLARLMSVFSGSKKYLSEFPRTAERIARFTEQEKGIEEMSECIRELFGDELDFACAKAMEKGREEGIEEGIEKGKEEAWKVMSEWFENGCSREEIQKKVESMLEKIKG